MRQTGNCIVICHEVTNTEMAGQIYVKWELYMMLSRSSGAAYDVHSMIQLYISMLAFVPTRFLAFTPATMTARLTVFPANQTKVCESCMRLCEPQFDHVCYIVFWKWTLTESGFLDALIIPVCGFLRIVIDRFLSGSSIAVELAGKYHYSSVWRSSCA